MTDCPPGVRAPSCARHHAEPIHACLSDLHDFMTCMSFHSHCMEEETDWKLLQLLSDRAGT